METILVHMECGWRLDCGLGEFSNQSYESKCKLIIQFFVVPFPKTFTEQICLHTIYFVQQIH